MYFTLCMKRRVKSFALRSLVHGLLALAFLATFCRMRVRREFSYEPMDENIAARYHVCPLLPMSSVYSSKQAVAPKQRFPLKAGSTLFADAEFHLEIENSSTVCHDHLGKFDLQLGSSYLPAEPVLATCSSQVQARKTNDLHFLIGCKYPYQTGHLLYNCLSHVYYILRELKILDGQEVVNFYMAIHPGTHEYTASVLATFVPHYKLNDISKLWGSNIRLNNVILGLQSSPLDHYNYDKSLWPIWKDFVLRLRTRTVDTKSTSDLKEGIVVVLIDRRKDRRILNIQELANAVADLDFVSRVQILYFEEMSLYDQIASIASANIVIGMDGTGLFNANFLVGNAFTGVIRVMPFMGDVTLPGKSQNFEFIWDGLGIPYTTVSVANSNCSNFKVPQEEFNGLVSAIYYEHMANISLHNIYPTILRQDSYLCVSCIISIVHAFFSRFAYLESIAIQ